MSRPASVLIATVAATVISLAASQSNSTAHYGKPPCLPDEQVVDAAGRGTVCAPKCVKASAPGFPGTCPTDVPAGTTLKPTCAIQDDNNPLDPNARYCALTCFVGGCPPGSSCQHILMLGLEGLCVYPKGDQVADIKLGKSASEEPAITV
eukprot:gnl/MRDRNA2_/MRDRNA2_118563_c0_seq1.p1 gnl/MRDRNA2_/MRDRNA2_118563_c0~~gnl/MRDRNA2_/MRDRNA2_118563_c0_seq1.p1  ORF type:complete len:150 (+),score=22.26 gnl/MRDRNA2_/MRDRNA2_118563_c0_seq1:90-539(+)